MRWSACPTSGTADAEYYGFHESAADLTALIAALHFDSVIDELLASTHGNLYTLNLVNRIAELSDNDQIRLAANPLSLLDFVAGWRDEHALAQPLTGAMFDIFVDIFHEELEMRGLITARQEDLSDRLEDWPDYHRVIQPIFDEAYAAAPDGFRAALIAARDTLGTYLAETWRRLSPDDLGYADVGRTLLAVDRMLSGGRYREHHRGQSAATRDRHSAVGPRLRTRPRAISTCRGCSCRQHRRNREADRIPSRNGTWTHGMLSGRKNRITARRDAAAGSATGTGTHRSRV